VWDRAEVNAVEFGLVGAPAGTFEQVTERERLGSYRCRSA